MSAWWYISFATDDAFLGAVIVDADDAAGAHLRATSLGLNPGGEAMILAVPEDAPNPEDMRLRLLSRNELLERLDGLRVGDQPEHEQDALRERADYVCEEHNKP